MPARPGTSHAFASYRRQPRCRPRHRHGTGRRRLPVFATGRSIDGRYAACRRRPHPVRSHARRRDGRRVRADRGALAPDLDVVVNSAWGGYERMVENGAFTWGLPFWEQPAHRWSCMMDAGVRAAFMVSARAARVMVPRKRGLIVNISLWAAQKRIGNTIYGVVEGGDRQADGGHGARARAARRHRRVALSRNGADGSRARRAARVARSLEQREPRVHRPSHCRARDTIRGCMPAADPSSSLPPSPRELGVTDIDGRQPVPLTLDNRLKPRAHAMIYVRLQ